MSSSSNSPKDTSRIRTALSLAAERWCAIKQRLFSDPSVRHQILRDYGPTVQPQGANAMAAELVTQLEQSPVDDHLAQNPSNADVFRAAVKALSSNSRAWATFLKSECKLSDLLRGY